jgi:hypothetical protein
MSKKLKSTNDILKSVGLKMEWILVSTEILNKVFNTLNDEGEYIYVDDVYRHHQQDREYRSLIFKHRENLYEVIYYQSFYEGEMDWKDYDYGSNKTNVYCYRVEPVKVEITEYERVFLKAE